MSDAEVLINMASMLEIPVSKLLGIGVDSRNVEDLTCILPPKEMLTSVA